MPAARVLIRATAIGSRKEMRCVRLLSIPQHRQAAAISIVPRVSP